LLRSQESGVRSQESGVRSQESGVKIRSLAYSEYPKFQSKYNGTNSNPIYFSYNDRKYHQTQYMMVAQDNIEGFNYFRGTKQNIIQHEFGGDVNSGWTIYTQYGVFIPCLQLKYKTIK
jgi:hypothetical protein